jgi:mRNA deadenylase, exonuclease subunit and related nucleases
MRKLILNVLVIGIAFLLGLITLSNIRLDQYKSYLIYFKQMGSFFSKTDVVKEAQTTIEELISKESVQLIDVVHSADSVPKSTSNIQFSVLSYNVLADGYSGLFASDAGSTYIDFKYRSPIVIEEIRRFNADIILLQEIDHYDDFYQPKLTELGYELIQGKRKNKIDSAVVGYKKDTFELISHKILDFNKGHKYEKNSDFIRNNVAVIAELKHKASGKIVIALGTHFFWNPKKEHVKYLQMAEVEKYLSAHYNDEDIIVWGGDLNSKPEDNNMVYLRERAPPTKERIEFYTEKMLKHQIDIYNELQQIEKHLTWGNVYELYGDSTGNKERKFPKYTNYNRNFKDVLDHILYTKKAVIPKKLLKIPDEKEIGTSAVPNRRYPSDHLPIMAVFEIL